MEGAGGVQSHPSHDRRLAGPVQVGLRFDAAEPGEAAVHRHQEEDGAAGEMGRPDSDSERRVSVFRLRRDAAPLVRDREAVDHPAGELFPWRQQARIHPPDCDRTTLAVKSVRVEIGQSLGRAMEARHLTTLKSCHVDIIRDRAALVTDDAKALCERLPRVTGKRITAPEPIGEMTREEPGNAAKAPRADGAQRARQRERTAGREEYRSEVASKNLEKAAPGEPSRPECAAGDGTVKARQAEPREVATTPSRGRDRDDTDFDKWHPRAEPTWLSP